jgi:uncharacterized membrane protein YkvI
MKSNREMWGMPVVLGVLTVIGLMVALVADGVWDLVSVAALAVPVLVGCWYGFKPARSPH